MISPDEPALIADIIDDALSGIPAQRHQEFCRRVAALLGANGGHPSASDALLVVARARRELVRD